MINYEIILSIFKIGTVCFFINIPFGMLRSRIRPYSLLWFICIHAPIPVSAVMRRAAGFNFWYAAIFILFGVAGQIVGKKAALKYFPVRDKN